MRRVLDVHLIIILMGIGALAMFVPFLHALIARDWDVARTFFYSGLLFGTLTLTLGIASYNSRVRNLPRSYLLALFATYLALPLMLAVPFYESLKTTGYLNAYFEMVASITTTGATLFDDPGRLAPSLHLWRALVGWMGGLFLWVAAIAILAPMTLGGFEVTSDAEAGRNLALRRDRALVGGIEAAADPRLQLLRAALYLAPVYATLTGVLWMALVMGGERSFVAICHAMSVMATSGISPVGGLTGGQAGVLGELLILPFFLFALSRQSFSPDNPKQYLRAMPRNSELRLAVFLIVSVPAVFFLRHWVGALDFNEQENVVAALQALWGSVFTVTSFLTTTGFVSLDWVQARNWSGLQTPGLVLMGLALVGGGVGTTAGGVKLLRMYALYKHGRREMERLIHPSSIGRAGAFARQLRRQGAFVAWVFFMLFALSLTAAVLCLSLLGETFENAIILSVAALSTTGPIATVVTDGQNLWTGLGAGAKWVLIATMVLGRLETLAIIALLNPGFWRR